MCKHHFSGNNNPFWVTSSSNQLSNFDTVVLEIFHGLQNLIITRGFELNSRIQNTWITEYPNSLLYDRSCWIMLRYFIFEPNFKFWWCRAQNLRWIINSCDHVCKKFAFQSSSGRQNLWYIIYLECGTMVIWNFFFFVWKLWFKLEVSQHTLIICIVR